jgi:hypothetical protein
VIRRAFCEYFVKALILDPRGWDDLQIQRFLDAMSLDYPGLWYISGLRDNLAPPETFHPKDRRHKPSRNFLIKEQVLDFFENGPDMQKAREIADRPRAREFVESMLLSVAPALAIARRLADMYRMRGMSVRGVELYRHYYFNVDLLDSSEARALLQLKISRLANSDDEEERRHADALKRAYYTDPRRTAASLPHSPVSALIAQLQMGLVPQSLDLKKLTESSEMLAHLRLAEALAAGGMKFDLQALNLATVASILQKLKETKLRPEDELKEQLATLSVKTNPSALPLVSEVTGGHHTVDLVALPTSKEPDESELQPGKK